MLKQIILAICLISCAYSMDTPTNVGPLSNILKKARDVDQCTVCLAIVNKAKTFLDSQTTQDELFEVLLKTCTLFSQTIDEQVKKC